MAGLKSYALGGATLVCAFGIGYVMQFGFGLPPSNGLRAPATVEVSAITDTSSALRAPKLAPQAPEGETLERIIAPEELDLGNLPDNFGQPAKALAPAPQPAPETASCDISMTATPTAGAQVDLTLSAPCNGAERVTFHHQGIMFTETMPADGDLTLRVPAIAERAIFIASFGNGDGATASADVTSLPFYDRVVVQWKGDAGLQLHAREFDADYFSDGHIWSDASGDLAAAARGEGGFLTRLGQKDAPDALIAEVYSFPSGTAKTPGEIILTVEAEITATNCQKAVSAQTLEIRGDAGLRVRDLDLQMPSCDSVGDFLVLKNLVEDLKIAAR
ncbi:hypothetical protein [Tropicibacter naphthalenivorans]|uniref:Translocase n=1 Tax=Tropicibacter naphthalenivorans TaxID=441103 RepID=A0A0P1GD89_9RHOB|nr:hypothetical protein [Tropicibacter naphthalenivorans]CUH79251.1 hypothetical protein TRN7648_02374 [Tropicibacter naphthalenivorans]SMC70866.1 hypothetical protein SAMN04488093_1034 [Tropicibacter naphthalenivorans]